MTTEANCERRTPSFAIAVILKITQGQEIFLFSRTPKPSPGPVEAPYLMVTRALSRRHRDRCVKLTTHYRRVLGLRSVAIYP